MLPLNIILILFLRPSTKSFSSLHPLVYFVQVSRQFTQLLFIYKLVSSLFLKDSFAEYEIQG